MKGNGGREYVKAFMSWLGACAWALGCASTPALSKPPASASSELELGRDALSRMTGCYVVDYNYHETKSLKPQYAVDPRVYDANRTRTAMEWIVALDEGERHVRLQHVLFLLDEKGNLVADSMIRHQAEDWEYEPAWVWEYMGESRWKRNDTPNAKGQWVRRITNLDDGLRYQCLAPWQTAGARIEWQCGDNFSPIPGRETRDMKRSDYQGLVRATRIVVFPSSWVERQKNVKTIVKEGKREPLAEEVARNWYIRAPDSQCAEAAKWTEEHLPFWKLVQQTWASYFANNTEWREKPRGGGPPRWAKMAEVEERHFQSIASSAEAKDAARREIQQVIEEDRLNE